MATFDKFQVAQVMKEQGLVPLFYNADVDIAIAVVEACYAGGARLLEFTNRGDFAHEVFGELNKHCRAKFPEMILGVGSINDAPTAALYMQLGANFIVSASLREDVARICNRRQVMYSPGCGSLTEVGKAEELGCGVVKLFPGSVYGPGFIKAIRGPQPWTKIMPTGGVAPNRDNLSNWFDSGAYCVGMGSKLIKPNPDGSYDYSTIEKRTAEVLEMISDIRDNT